MSFLARGFGRSRLFARRSINFKQAAAKVFASVEMCLFFKQLQ
jgi:hypothetical protein